MQKADEERGRIIPLSEVASITVAAPTQEDEGKLIVLMQGERRPSRENVLYYEDEQHEEALQFKAAFDRITRRSRSEAARPRQVRTPPAEARRQTGTAQARPRQVQAEKAPAKKGKLKKIVLWVVGVYVALLAVVGISLLLSRGGQDEAGGGVFQQQTPARSATPLRRRMGQLQSPMLILS